MHLLFTCSFHVLVRIDLDSLPGYNKMSGRSGLRSHAAAASTATASVSAAPAAAAAAAANDAEQPPNHKSSRRRKRASSTQAGERSTSARKRPAIAYVVQVDHRDQFGAHTEILGIYTNKASAAKVVRSHIDCEYGRDHVTEYEEGQTQNGFPYVEASGWEGESMRVSMQQQSLKR